jgi:hypothetical protein
MRVYKSFDDESLLIKTTYQLIHRTRQQLLGQSELDHAVTRKHVIWQQRPLLAGHLQILQISSNIKLEFLGLKFLQYVKLPARDWQISHSDSFCLGQPS